MTAEVPWEELYAELDRHLHNVDLGDPVYKHGAWRLVDGGFDHSTDLDKRFGHPGWDIDDGGDDPVYDAAGIRPPREREPHEIGWEPGV